jgi:YHS domain-containing protein
MIRTIVYLLIAILLISLLRAVIGAIGRAFSGLLQPKDPPPSRSRPGTSGELKKDPVCGTFVATATSVKETVHGEVVHFCSRKCRDKYIASLTR